MDAERTLDRARGALLGLAAGDAVGTTVEFSAPGTFPPVTDMVGGGPFDLEPGQWTDDTSMALALAESIVDTGALDPADQLRRYLMWRDHGYLSSTGRCFDIGHTTTTALSRFARHGTVADDRPDQEAAANGSLMRLAPVPIAWHRDGDEAVTRSGESSRTTHPADRPVDTCRLLGAMVADLIAGADADEVLGPDLWRWGPLHPEVEAIARGGWRTKQPPAIRGTGYCVAALEAAVWAVAGAADPGGAILRAANLGDDADTTAAIAGQIAGARWGASALPPPWLERLHDRHRITSLADALHDQHAPPPPPPWRHDTLVHAWWVEPGRVLAGEHPTTRDGGDAKLDVLLDQGIRTFVDLTHPGDGLRGYAADLATKAERRGLDTHHLAWPIPDLGIVGTDTYRAIVAEIREHATAGRPVYVHCWGGVGRTGTVVSCLLARPGDTVDDLESRLAHLRAGTSKEDRPCPESAAQRALLADWCATLSP